MTADTIDLRCTRMAELPPAPGVHPDVPPEVYHSWAALSASQINIAHRSMAHLEAYRNGDFSISSSGFGFGTLAHHMTLEPDRPLDEFQFYPAFGDLRSKIGKDARDRWLASVGVDIPGKAGWDEAVWQFGDRLVPESDIDRGHLVAARIRAHPMARHILDAPGGRELSCVWRDETTGLPCKIRVDIWDSSHLIIADLKTTADASRFGFGRSAGKFGYHRQAAWYSHGWRQVAGDAGLDPDCDFVIIACEKEPPYLVSVHQVGGEELRTGSIECRKIRDSVSGCVSRGQWPGYGDDVMDLELPPYLLASEHEGGEL